MAKPAIAVRPGGGHDAPGRPSAASEHDEAHRLGLTSSVWQSMRVERPMPPARRQHRAPRQGAATIAQRLAQHAEVVCRHYLSSGRRSGGYWHVGDVANTPGQSLYVRLCGPRAGKWCDAATAQHGDLLDLIVLTRKLPSLKQALAEARQFLDGAVALPAPRAEPGASDKTRAAQRLFGKGRPIPGTP